MKIKTHYKDFRPTIDNCKDEPIHQPCAVYGDSFLLALDPLTFHIEGVSDNFLQLLGLEKENCLGQLCSTVLPDNVYDALAAQLGQKKWGGINPLKLSIKGLDFDAIGHLSGDLLILEFERQPNGTPQGYDKRLQRLIGALEDCNEEQAFFDAMTKEFKDFSGYDRVMVYRFDEDWSGEVVGEAKEAHLEPFLGLRYPATDIPPIARRLFLENRSRIISNIYTPSSPIHLSDHVDLPQGLDLSLAQHRATSPIHIEYLHNMGVGATLTVAIIVNQQLWGLIVSHHYSSYSISYQQRKVSEIMSMVFSKRIIHLEKDRMDRESESFLLAEQALIQSIKSTDDVTHEARLLNNTPSINDLCSADGTALVVGNKVTSKGHVPSDGVVLELVKQLRSQGKDDEFATRSVVDSLGVSSEFISSHPGLMSIGLSVEQSLFILWFKKPFHHTVSWGGNPNEAFIIGKDENEQGMRLSPRKSFAKWQDFVKDKSAPWESYEKAMAHRLRETLIKLELDRSGDAIRSLNNRLSATLNKELDQIIYIASHDLQEPLRTIRSFGKLLERSASEKLTKDELFFLKRITLASDRMKMLVTNLLDYSRIGRSIDVETVDLNQVVKEIKEDFEQKIKETGATILSTDLPKLEGDFIELKRLFQNLISNALKYCKKGVPPVVDISARKEETKWYFEVADNGIGMEKQYLQKIFMLFQRLHSKDEYEGTGIGLAQCQKIIEAYSGNIYAESEPGKGSVFYFSLMEKKV